MKSIVLKLFISSLLFLYLPQTLSAQEDKMTLTLLDGSQKVGTGYITDRIFFTDNADVKKKRKKYNSKQVKSVHSIEDGEEHHYVYRKMVYPMKWGMPLLLELEEKGAINYYIAVKVRSYNSGPNGARVSNPLVHTYTYIGWADQEEVWRVNAMSVYSNKFEKIKNEFFGKCPAVLKKIDEEYFRKRDLRGVVRSYNENCK